MTISATEENVRNKGLRKNSRQTQTALFMSVDEKERPALEKHLNRVYKEVLATPPEDVSLAFEDEVVVKNIEKSSTDNGGILRITVFRVIGESLTM